MRSLQKLLKIPIDEIFGLIKAGRESFQTILPDEIMYRKKMGFSVPLADWLRGELREMASKYLFTRQSGISNFLMSIP